MTAREHRGALENPPSYTRICPSKYVLNYVCNNARNAGDMIAENTLSLFIIDNANRTLFFRIEYSNMVYQFDLIAIFIPNTFLTAVEPPCFDLLEN